MPDESAESGNAQRQACEYLVLTGGYASPVSQRGARRSMPIYNYKMKKK